MTGTGPAGCRPAVSVVSLALNASFSRTVIVDLDVRVGRLVLLRHRPPRALASGRCSGCATSRWSTGAAGELGGAALVERWSRRRPWSRRRTGMRPPPRAWRRADGSSSPSPPHRWCAVRDDAWGGPSRTLRSLPAVASKVATGVSIAFRSRRLYDPRFRGVNPIRHAFATVARTETSRPAIVRAWLRRTILLPVRTRLRRSP